MANVQNYILDDNKRPIKATLQNYMNWSLRNEKRLKYTQIREGVSVSTVFVGIDLNEGKGEPAYWETALIENGKVIRVVNSGVHAQAVRNHEDLVKNAKTPQ